MIIVENDVFEHFDPENAKIGFRIRVHVCRILSVCFERQATQQKFHDVLVHEHKAIPHLRVGEARGSAECAHVKAGSTRLGELIKNHEMIAVDDICKMM